MPTTPSINVILDIEREMSPAVRRLLDRQVENTGSVKDSYDPATGQLKGLIHLTDPFEMGVMTNGTDQGQPVVFIAITLPSGQVVLQETTLRLLQNAAMVIRTRYPDESIDRLRSDLADLISTADEDAWERTFDAVCDRLGIGA